MEANPQRFFFVANLQDSSILAQLEGERGRETTDHGGTVRAFCDLQSLRVGKEEGDHDEGEEGEKIRR